MQNSQQLEGLKLAKFLKRATGSKRMSSALLKTAILGGTAYYTNKKYGWVNKIKPHISSKPVKVIRPQEKGANNWFNADFLKNIVYSFLPPQNVPQEQIPQVQTNALPQNTQNLPEKTKTMLSNPLVLAGIVGAGFLLLRRK